MIRTILRADGRVEKKEVGKGFRKWNAAIGASYGTIVQGQIVNTEKGSIDQVELWCDEEALCKADPVQNFYATVIAGQGQVIFGDVIIFLPGDIT